MSTFNYSFVSASIKDVLERYRTLAKANPERHFEYELRIGKWTGKFTPGVSKAQFYEVMKSLEERFPDAKGPTEKETIRYYEGGVRVIEYPSINIVEISQKTNLLDPKESYMRDFYFGEWNIRQALAEEKSLEEFDTAKVGPPLIKNRLSTSFTFDTARVDMRESLPDGPYEIEVEFMLPPDEVDINTFIAPFSQVMEVLTTATTPIIIKQAMDIKERYNALWVTGKRPLPYFPIKKPINLKKAFLKRLESAPYIILPKIDGVRYFLYFSMYASYLINNKDIIYYKPHSNIDLEGVVLDGELYNGTFYAFDALMAGTRRYPNIGGISVEKENFDKRFNVIENTHRKFSGFQIMPMWEKKFTGFMEIIDSDRFELDGVIFTPLEDKYDSPSNYKFKPIELMTVDFKAVKLGDMTYQLFSGNRVERTQVLFKGSDKYPFSGVITVDQDGKDILGKGDSVFEFKWDGTTFVPYRARPDKLYPNDITVALDIWEDLHEPILEEELLITLAKSQGIAELPSISLPKIKRALGVRIQEKEEPEKPDIPEFKDIKWNKTDLVRVVQYDKDRTVLVTREGMAFDEDNELVNVPYDYWRAKILGLPLPDITPEKKEKSVLEKLKEAQAIEKKLVEQKQQKGEEREEDLARHLVKDKHQDKTIPETTTIKGVEFSNLFSLDDKCDWINVVLFAVMPKYRDMPIDAQVQYVGRIEKSLIENNKMYKRMKKESKFRKVYSEMVEKFYDSLSSNPEDSVDYSSLDEPLKKVFYNIFIKKYKELYTLVATIISRESLSEIFSSIDEEVPYTFIKKVEQGVREKMQEVFSTIPGCVEEDKEEFIVNQGVAVFKNLGKSAIEKIYRKVKVDEITTCRDILSSASGEFFLDKLNVSVHVLNDKNKVKKTYGSGEKNIFFKFFGERVAMLGIDGRAYFKENDPVFQKVVSQ